ncbi:MAG TPA: thiosulfate oxidation carrier protein SoxY, partial [Burkholderiaceae bacterium]|nr:thiosulfate oxidation carrier protein SoxY [Burkholderiaceae bacterium]
MNTKPRSPSSPTLRRRLLIGAGAWPLLAAPAVRAAIGGLPTNTGHDDTSPEWELLRQRLYGERPLATGRASRIQLIAPLRAAYGASVPVKIVSGLPQRPELYVKRLQVLVDKNPSPL